MTDITYKGLVQFSRISGSKQLYMSNLNNANWIKMRVYAGEDSERYGQKHVFVKSQKPLIDIELSSAQFAELITTMNVGEGTPCTLNYVTGLKIDQATLKDDEKPLNIGEKYFKKSTTEFTDNLNKMTSKLKKELETIIMSKKNKCKITKLLNTVETEVNSNMPFYVSVFEESAKKVVTESKIEIDAFLTGEIVKAGLEALGIKSEQLLLKSEE